MSDPKANTESEAWSADQQAVFATKPTSWTCFWRVFFPYQVWRFIRINIKMLRVIWKGHH